MPGAAAISHHPVAGQTQPTRVVRLLAQDSVERQVLEVRQGAPAALCFFKSTGYLISGSSPTSSFQAIYEWEACAF